MEKLNNFINKFTSPLSHFITIVVQFCLGTSFFLHGYGKIPMSDNFIAIIAPTIKPIPDNISDQATA